MSGSYQSLISNVEAQNGIPNGLLSSLLGAESTFNPNAYNATSGAMGIAQIEPATASNPGYGIAPINNPYDPNQAIPFAGQYLAALASQTGSWLGAAQAYGTIPATGPLTQGQASVYNAATGSPAPDGLPMAPHAGLLNYLFGNQVTGSNMFSDIGLRIGIGFVSLMLITMGAAVISFGSVSRGAGKIMEVVK